MTSRRMEKAVDNFREILSKWQCAYKVVELSCVAVKTYSVFHLLAGRVVLFCAKDKTPVNAVDFETEHLLAFQVVEQVSDIQLESILDAVGKRTFPTKTGVIPLQSQGENENRHVQAFFSPFGHPAIQSFSRLPTLLLYGAPKHKLLEGPIDRNTLDWELKGAEYSYDGLDELLFTCGFPPFDRLNESTSLETIAMPPAIIVDSSRITDGQAQIDLRLAKILPREKLALGCKIVHPGSPPEHLQVNRDQIAWQEEGDFHIGRCHLNVGSAIILRAFLDYDRLALHQWWVTDPDKNLNPRRTMHTAFDQDLRILNEMLLAAKKDQAHEFETALSLLLFILGFSATNSGRISKLTDGPDNIAVTPAGNVAVIECTLGTLDKGGKLSKLVQRTEALRREMQEAHQGSPQIQPVIVSPLERAELVADFETAAKHQIAVVGREDLEELLKMASLPMNAEMVFARAKQAIPSLSPQQTPNQGTGK